MINNGRKNILGIQIDAVDYEGAVEAVTNAAKNKQPFAISALAVHGVMTGVLDRVHRYRLNDLEMVVPDGQPVRWALNLLHGAKLPDRVYGPTLTLKVCERAAKEGLPIFLFGGTQDLLNLLKTRLEEKFPGILIAGMKASKFRRLNEQERDELVEEIKATGAAITLCGIGCPRQEVWAFEFRKRLSMPVLAVGAAFNFHAGLLPQAPPLMQDYGFEWLFRLVQEPKRLWRRYLYLNPLYASLFAAQYLHVWRPNLKDADQPTGEILYG
ncbi:WecB/TagA/CpsF family glycosyltransferase [Lacunimicrobium album]